MKTYIMLIVIVLSFSSCSALDTYARKYHKSDQWVPGQTWPEAWQTYKVKYLKAKSSPEMAAVSSDCEVYDKEFLGMPVLD